MWSTESLIILWQVLLLGAVLDAVLIDNNLSCDHLPERCVIYATVTGIRRPDYTYTVGVGAHKIFPGTANWNTARRTCGEDGAHLVIINSLTEAEVVVRLLKSKNFRGSWIGVHDLYQEGEFVTIHDGPLAQTGYNAWYQGKPNNGAVTDENCVVVYNNTKLFDVWCGYRYNFVCELPSAQLQVPEAPQPSTP